MMNRRQFTKLAGLSLCAVSAGKLNGFQKSPPTQIALTMDDFNWQNTIHQSAAVRNKSILETLNSHSLKTALFVIGRNIESDEGKQLLSAWNSAGHLLGNHTYSHQNLNAPTISTQVYNDDILRAEKLLTEFTGFKKYFRFPMLKEGDTVAKRDDVRSFLEQHQYRVGHVTIDTSDWVITSRLTDRLRSNPKADIQPYRDFYLAHMWDRAQYYDSLSRQVLGRPLKHTILTHYNLLNGLFLNDLIEMFKAKGWQWIDAAEAFSDPVFSAKPNILPAGESIVWAVAKGNGAIAKTLKYPAEDGDVVAEEMKKLGL